MITNVPSDKKSQDIKSRNWFIELYPESAVKNWREVLAEQLVPCAVSPLHDSDLREDGTPKKEHYHILIAFNGGARVNQVNSIIKRINAYEHCQVVRDKQKSYEYLWHKNNPEKAQYDPCEVDHINSTKYDFLTSQFKEILNYIDDYDVKSVVTLTRLLRRDESDDLLRYVRNNIYYVNTYIKDKNNQYEERFQNARQCLMDLVDRIQLKGLVNSADIKRLVKAFEQIGMDLDIEVM